jgi:hypothetical protein
VRRPQGRRTAVERPPAATETAPRQERGELPVPGFTGLIRLDRLRGTPYTTAANALLMRDPSWRSLVNDVGLDGAASIDAALVSTLDGLSSPGLLVASHGLRGNEIARRPEPLANGFIRVVQAHRLLSVPPQLQSSPFWNVAGDTTNSWSSLLTRVDADDPFVPPNAVAMVSLTELAARQGLDALISSLQPAPPPSPADPTGTARMGELPAPIMTVGVLGLAPEPFIDIDANFSRADDAGAWERTWPLLTARVAASKTGGLDVNAIVQRVSLTTSGACLHLHLDIRDDEVLELLTALATATPA